TAAMAVVSGKTSTTTWHERRDLFPEGVASAEPTFDSVLLWTRYPAGTVTSAGTQPHATAAGQAGPALATAAHDNGAAGSTAGVPTGMSKTTAAANGAETQPGPTSSGGARGPTSATLTVEIATDPRF